VFRKLPEVTANVSEIMEGSRYLISLNSLTFIADIFRLVEFWMTKAGKSE
jgi:hypothetical protein